MKRFVMFAFAFLLCIGIMMGLSSVDVHAEERSSEGTAYAVLTDDGELILFRSNVTYSAGPGKTVTDILGNSYTGRVYTGIETTSKNNNTANCLWYNERSSIKSVRIADGQKILPKNCCNWFYTHTNLITCDLRGLDAQNVSLMNFMFQGCSRLVSVNMSDCNSSNVTSLQNMFTGCTNLVNVDLTGFDASNVTSMYMLFANCSNLVNIDLSMSSSRRFICFSGLKTIYGATGPKPIRNLFPLKLAIVLALDFIFLGDKRNVCELFSR